MLDVRLRRLIDPPLDAAGRYLARRGATPDAITLAGFAAGLAAAAAIAIGLFWLALALIAINRIADGLDGAVARATRRSDRGGFLDIVLDFCFYAAVPVAFAVAAPARNALAATVLLAAFLANGAAFLAFAAIAARRGVTVPTAGMKSMHYLAGLAEGTETIAVFVLMCLWPAGFPVLAYLFAALCFLSAAARIAAGARAFEDPPAPPPPNTR